MKFRSRIRGPKLRVKLMFLAVVLLAVPWLAYTLLVEMERLLVQGQQNAQLLMASSVATQLNNRPDLFNDLPVQIEHSEHLYAPPIDGNILIDGNSSDWGRSLESSTRTFGSGDGSFDLTLGEQINKIYGFLRIRDSDLVYRDPGIIAIDTADHVRIEFEDESGQRLQLALTFSSPGIATTYLLDEQMESEGTPITSASGYLNLVDTGISIEFVFPLSILGSNRRFAISYFDVDDPNDRTVRSITRTIPSTDNDQFDLVVLRSAETIGLIESLGYVDARILVVDVQHRVRGETEITDPASQTGLDETQESLDLFKFVRPYLRQLTVGRNWQELTSEEAEEIQTQAIESALRGEPTAVQRVSARGTQSILATQPIRSQGSILGAVVLEQEIEHILAFQQRALEKILLVSLFALGIAVVAALGYSVRLAYRIQKLRRSATQAIDQHGRLTVSSLDAEVSAGDEIGELARTMDGMIHRLNQHHAFLRNMPRTLRHEINNPLNTLSTSLENLRNSSDRDSQDRYLESARRGVNRIGSIVQGLADAASVEDSLTNEDLEDVDIQALLTNYVANLRLTRPEIKFIFRGVPGSAYANVSDFHIEQMLDKIFDNAIDFHHQNSPIKIQLDQGKNLLRISVANRGPQFQGNIDTLFESLVSQRSEQSKLHFGLGLYVVRVIAEYHRGRVRAMNLADGSGVVISVDLPLTHPREITRSKVASAA